MYSGKMLQTALVKHPVIRTDQIISLSRFQQEIKSSVSQQDKIAAHDAYISKYEPYRQSHHFLVKKIEKHLSIMFDSTCKRKCVACTKTVGFFESHCICLNESYSSTNCGSNLSQRLHCDSANKLGYVYVV